MTEIKPVYQRSSCGVEWSEITFDFYSRYAGADGYCYRILYPAAAYEALQKENARLQWEKDNVQRLGVKANEALKAAYESLQKNCAKLLDEQDREYNRKTNELINRHAAQVETLQKENAFVINDLHIARSNIRTLKAETAAQAKRIEELEAQISSQMNFGERMIINSDGDVVGDDTERVVAKFSHWNEAESFCEAANFKYSASKNG